MYPEMTSDKELWFELFRKWDEHRVDTPAIFETALTEMKKISRLVCAYGDLGTPTPPYTLDDVYTFAEHTNALWSFTNSVHNEVEDLIDWPFTTAAGNTLKAAYDLNPSDVTITRSGMPPVSLTAVFMVLPVDAPLKADLARYTRNLDNDTIDEKPELAAILEEAAFWQGEYERAKDIAVIVAEVFPPEVRESWPDMTPDEREAIAQAFVEAIGVVLGAPGGPVVTKIDWTGRTVALYPGTTVEVNKGFVEYRDGVKSNVDRMIDAVIHECYHMRQYRLRANPKENGVPQSVAAAWNEPYIEKDKPHPQDPGRKATYEEYSRQPLEYDARAFAALCV